mmetsp:Transcript_78480/g.122458  ORF Transcript_78480/g.122458 Transcript_78480/m.122458 type:complete len:145 (+) Transcript_78480:1-435(+)
MESAVVKPNVVSYSACIDAFAKQGDGEGAAEWHGNMVSAELEPNDISYTTVMCAFARQGDGKRAAAWLAKMEAAELAPTAATYDAVSVAFTQQGNGEAAAEWLQACSTRAAKYSSKAMQLVPQTNLTSYKIVPLLGLDFTQMRT